MALFASLLRRPAKNNGEEPSGVGGKGERLFNPPPEEITRGCAPLIDPAAKAAPLHRSISKEAWDEGECFLSASQALG